MKLAAARAGLWFFGSIAFVLLFLNRRLKDLSLAEQIISLLFIGFIVGGIAFSWALHDIAEEEYKQQLAERRKALQSDRSGTNQ